MWLKVWGEPDFDYHLVFLVSFSCFFCLYFFFFFLLLLPLEVFFCAELLLAEFLLLLECNAFFTLDDRQLPRFVDHVACNETGSCLHLHTPPKFLVSVWGDWDRSEIEDWYSRTLL